MAPGQYYVVLRTNILDSFPESNLTNNLSASLTQTSVDAPTLTPGVPATGSLAGGQSAYYKVNATAGQTFQLALSTTASADFNELYVSYGTMPTRSKYDFRYQSPGANQQILIPNAQQGSYYILAYASSVGGASEPYSLVANVIPFGLLSVDQATIGNSGASTLEIRGSKLDTATSFTLTGPGGATIAGTNPLIVDSTDVFVTFNARAPPRWAPTPSPPGMPAMTS